MVNNNESFEKDIISNEFKFFLLESAQNLQNIQQAKHILMTVLNEPIPLLTWDSF